MSCKHVKPDICRDIMTLSWQHTDGEWNEFPQDQINNILSQQADRALTMLASFLPVVMKHEGGYICTKDLYPAIRQKHQKCITFEAALKSLKNPGVALYQAL